MVRRIMQALFWRSDVSQLVLLQYFSVNELVWKSEEFLLNLLILKLCPASLVADSHTTLLFVLILVPEEV